jgi:hypothetical protein
VSDALISRGLMKASLFQIFNPKSEIRNSAMSHYLKVWLACARYSVVRTMMFRGDFIVWSLVEFFWMSVNLLLISVIYEHTSSIAGWSRGVATWQAPRRKAAAPSR